MVIHIDRNDLWVLNQQLLDGRGAGTCLYQLRFMAGLLDFQAMKTRIEACLVFEATVLKNGVRQEALPLHQSG